MTVTRYLIGQADLTYDLVCTTLLPVIRLLDKRLMSKVEYMEEVFNEEKQRLKLKSPKANDVKGMQGQFCKSNNIRTVLIFLVFMVLIFIQNYMHVKSQNLQRHFQSQKQSLIASS